jgi:hypothetical protein
MRRIAMDRRIYNMKRRKVKRLHRVVVQRKKTIDTSLKYVQIKALRVKLGPLIRL